MTSITETPRHYFNAAASQFRLSVSAVPSHAFHESMEGYGPTPLREIPELAQELGIARLFVKDESNRLSLPAFKILGASWAVCKAISRELGLDPEGMTIQQLKAELSAAQKTDLVLVTATDGNHGRAVSRMASMLGLRARIYIPDSISEAAQKAIADEGAEVVSCDVNYDDVVEKAAASVVGNPLELLIQDTSWPGYTDVPSWIIEGYMTLFAEVDEQLKQLGVDGPDLVACPVGVGSLAQSMVTYYRGTATSAATLLSVEPASAPCVLNSLVAGEITSVDTSNPTMMTGLNCGTPTERGWPTLQSGLTAAVEVDESACRKAVEDLQAQGQDSGPCGAASLAGVRALANASVERNDVGLSSESVVVLISTEGIAANPMPGE